MIEWGVVPVKTAPFFIDAYFLLGGIADKS